MRMPDRRRRPGPSIARCAIALLVLHVALIPLAHSAPRFEVASVRACKGETTHGRKGGGRESSPDRLFLPCQTAMSLIHWAYGNFAGAHFDPMASLPISGAPAWTITDRYQIEAKVAHAEPPATLNGEMLRALLEDRFNLRVHRETRQIPVYALTVAKNGPHLHAAKLGACIAFAPDPGKPLPIEPGKPLPSICGMAHLTNAGLDVPGVTMQGFSTVLKDYADRPVVDRTGLAGAFDIHLDLSPADLGHAGQSDPAEVFATLRAAIGKLGLRLNPTTGPSEFLVIDRISRPSGN